MSALNLHIHDRDDSKFPFNCSCCHSADRLNNYMGIERINKFAFGWIWWIWWSYFVALVCLCHFNHTVCFHKQYFLKHWFLRVNQSCFSNWNQYVSPIRSCVYDVCFSVWFPLCISILICKYGIGLKTINATIYKDGTIHYTNDMSIYI